MPRWLLYGVLTLLSWGVWGVLALPLAHLPGPQSQALSTVGIVPLLAAVALSPRVREGARPARGARLALAAGLVAGLGNLGYYEAVALGAQASVAVSLTALYPLATIAIAFAWLGERPGRVQLLGIVAALAAIYLLNAGGGNAEARWLAWALAPILLWGLAGVLTKLATDHASAELGGFWFLAAYLPLSALLVALYPMTWRLPARDWLFLGLLGFTYGLGNLTVLAAYRSGGKASIVTPLAGLYPVVTIPLAILFFGERIVPRQAAGVALALLALAALVREPRRPEAPPVPGATPSPVRNS